MKQLMPYTLLANVQQNLWSVHILRAILVKVDGVCELLRSSRSHFYEASVSCRHIEEVNDAGANKLAALNMVEAIPTCYEIR